MNILPVRKISRNFCCIDPIDEEYKRIIEKLLALGIQPSGNKIADKEKLRRYEMQQIQIDIGADGKGYVNKANYLTLSSEEIDRIINDKKLKSNEQDDSKQENNNDSSDNFTGSSQEAILNKHFLVKKKSKFPTL